MKEIISNLIFPSVWFLAGFLIVISTDLITGIRKAAKNNEATTSKGLRRTIDKMSSYVSLMLMVLTLLNLGNLSPGAQGYRAVFDFTINGLVLGCVYIESKSILENLIELNTNDGVKNDLCIYIFCPLHNLLILKLKNIFNS